MTEQDNQYQACMIYGHLKKTYKMYKTNGYLSTGDLETVQKTLLVMTY